MGRSSVSALFPACFSRWESTVWNISSVFSLSIKFRENIQLKHSAGRKRQYAGNEERCDHSDKEGHEDRCIRSTSDHSTPTKWANDLFVSSSSASRIAERYCLGLSVSMSSLDILLNYKDQQYSVTIHSSSTIRQIKNQVFVSRFRNDLWLDLLEYSGGPPSNDIWQRHSGQW